MSDQNEYDLVIIGSGPAGLAASIYASRYKLSNLVLGKKQGGTIGLAHNVENYPGFKQVSGLNLMNQIEEHATHLGAKIVYDPVQKIEKDGDSLKVYTVAGKEVFANSVVIATGTRRKKLNIPGEEKYLGKGVSYCTTCDAPFYQDQKVALIGGSDGAVSGAVHVAEYAEKVYLIYRGEKLKAEPAWKSEWKKIEDSGKGVTIFNTNVTQIKGDGKRVQAIQLDKPFQGKKELGVNGIFIEIGGVPGTKLAEELGVETDDNGYIEVDKNMQTNISGVFAAGDCTNFLPDVQQMITASAMGAIAARGIYEYVKQEEAPQQKGI
jgi:thioredoxin reductase (NADPH)